jgi:hypothetical protein
MWTETYIFITCMSGPGVIACNQDCTGGCWEWRPTMEWHVCYDCCHRPDCRRSLDFDHDGDVDLFDYAEWMVG